jgi:hypothetical protein
MEGKIDGDRERSRTDQGWHARKNLQLRLRACDVRRITGAHSVRMAQGFTASKSADIEVLESQLETLTEQA